MQERPQDVVRPLADGLKFVGQTLRAYAFSNCPGLYALRYLAARGVEKLKHFLWPCSGWLAIYRCEFGLGHEGKHRAEGRGCLYKTWVEWNGSGKDARDIDYVLQPCF